MSEAGTVTAVLFDIDGTLVDSNDQHVLAWQAAFAQIGAEIDRQVIHDQIGKGTDMLVPTLLPDLGGDGQERLGKAHGEIFAARYLDGIRPFAGARDLLMRVHASGRQVVLASSASASELDHHVGLLGVADIVSATTTSDDVERTKPAPDIFATAIAKIGSPSPRQVVVVGDTPYDMQAATQCGVAGIGLRSGAFPDAALQSAGAVTVYDDVAALLADFDRSPLAG